MELQQKSVIGAVPVDVQEILDRSVQTFPKESGASSGIITMWFAQLADEIIPWGQSVSQRDYQLRRFWPIEPTLAGTIFGISAAHAAFSWTLDGPARTVDQVSSILHTANFGSGWVDWIIKGTTDLLTQDNGWFSEVIRNDNSDPRSPIIGIAHLDAATCVRTGDPIYPVVHTDREGRRHKMPYWQVMTFEEMPSPIREMNNVQYCAVTRVLRAAQILRDIDVYKSEKVSGRWQKVIHIVGGPAKAELEAQMKLTEAHADNMGLRRYMVPTILASLDPSKPVSHVEIPLATLPDNFDMDVEMKWYITQLANGFGLDYQDLAPMPGGNLGSGQQSETLHLKSRGKGPALFMKIVEHKLNFFGVMPRTVKMLFDQQDINAEIRVADLKLKRAQRRQTMIQSREITPEMSRQIAADEGDLDPAYLVLTGEGDVTSDATISDSENENPEDIQKLPKVMEPPEKQFTAFNTGGTSAGGQSTGSQRKPGTVTATSSPNKGRPAGQSNRKSLVQRFKEFISGN